ncbi:hypothetical protein Q5752_004806 [Cryptotrichosporon argae]
MSAPTTALSPRQAAVAAAEARLARPAPPGEPSATPSPAPASAAAPAPNAALALAPARRSPPATFSLAISTKPSTPAWTVPTPEEDATRRAELGRVLMRTVVRHAAYASAVTCVETLIKISQNITASSDLKYRDLRASNGALKSKVLDVPGGHDYMILMGFRTETRGFEKHYIVQQTPRRAHELRIATEALQDLLPVLQQRAKTKTAADENAKKADAARVAAALREIEADREAVRARAERERFAREAREAKIKAEEEERRRLEEEIANMGADWDKGQGAGAVPAPTGQVHQTGGRSDDNDDDDDEDDAYEETGLFTGPGQRLGDSA